MRGICAVFVCLFHFHANSAVQGWGLIRGSWQFVDFFFVLSGFVISYNYEDKLQSGMPARQFMALRLGRIYPLHIAVLAAFVAMELLALLGPLKANREPFDAAHSISGLISNIFLLRGFSSFGAETWNNPSWSIATEAWAYVIFASLVIMRVNNFKVLSALVVGCAALLLYVTTKGTAVTGDFGLLRCIYGFALGVICAKLWRHLPDFKLSAVLWTVIEFAAIFAVIFFLSTSGETRWTVLGPLLFAVTVLVFARDGGYINRGLSTRLPVYIGALSYSIYMVHVFVQERMANVLNILAKKTKYDFMDASDPLRPPLIGETLLQGTVLTVVMLALVIAVSMLTYKFIELPGQAWTRRALAKYYPPKKPAAAPALAVEPPPA
ncbi:MAG TPA: acyltransferase [Polymorphobacter sp.]|jgi:peptidoglycan/LPS O-acetylase OafA/YrhL|nr:acyltransferase [Polymorphobacter sp.]